MKYKIKNNNLEVTTIIYQARNGAIFMDWGNTGIKLEKDYAESVAYDIPDFDQDQFNKFYSKS